jgi:hypothetical protein
VAGQKAKRSSRKRRNPGRKTRAVRSDRREERGVKAREAAAAERPPPRSSPGVSGSALGERPASPFGGLPVSEFAIFVGLIALVFGLIVGGASIIVGIVVIACGVIEVTAREHFSGYRSHATLLAALPAVGTELLLVAIFGTPHKRAAILLPVIPVFGLSFWFLRERFRTARQRRIARPPAPGRAA